MEHPTDDMLSAYALDPLLVPDRRTLEVHLAHCADCRARLDAVRSFDILLEDADSWPEDNPLPQRELLLQQDAMRTSEDAEAEELLRKLLDGSSGVFVWANLPEKPRYHTGGVVRRLCAHAASVCYATPLYALNLADTAIAISSLLSADRYGPADLASWRGTAWKMRANALRLLGRYPGALEALDRAERCYRALPRPELDLAAVLFVRATVFLEQQEYERAATLAEDCTRAFSQLGQTEMYLRGYLLQGTIAFETRDLITAHTIFERIHAYGEATGVSVWVARSALALSNCLIETARLSEATQYLSDAMRRFHEMGVLIEEIRCRWGLARVAQKSGSTQMAISRLRNVREEFTRIGVTTDAALVTLDLVEIYIMLRKWRDAQKAAGNIVTLFRDAGMLTGALTAANWLRHAARMKTLTPSTLEYTRRYFRSVELQPDRAFVPPVAL